MRALDTADDAYDAAKAVGKADDINIGITKRELLLSKTTNQEVRNAVDQLYRPGAITGDGGTADAIRHEMLNQTKHRGRSHIQKGQDWLRALKRIQKTESLTSVEEDLLLELIDDLEKALRGE